jgi:very-short-patch-repair endonuclease
MRRQPTPAEAALWERLREHELAELHFQRQYVLGEFIADFYCHAARLVVEVDGDVHDGQVERDDERDGFLAAQEMRILRFRNERVLNDIYAVLREIRCALPTADPSPEAASAASALP